MLLEELHGPATKEGKDKGHLIKMNLSPKKMSDEWERGKQNEKRVKVGKGKKCKPIYMIARWQPC